MCQVLRLGAKARLRSGVTDRYVQDLEHVIRGNIDWAMEVPRYQVGDRVVADSYGLSEQPADASPLAPGISSIDWWWQV
jgi:hypothetical protein